MRQTEIDKMIALLKTNPNWLKGDTSACCVPVDYSKEHVCLRGCPIRSKREPHKRIYTKGTVHCGDSFLVKLNRMREEERLEILTAAL